MRIWLRVLTVILVICVIGVSMAIIIGQPAPEGWELIYAERTSSASFSHWTVYIHDVDRNLPVPIFSNLAHQGIPTISYVGEWEVPLALSPDRRYVVQNADVFTGAGAFAFLIDLHHHTFERLSHAYDQVAWSPDGRYLAYTARGSDQIGIIELNTDGTPGTYIPIGDIRRQGVSPAWSPDGTILAFSGYSQTPRTFNDLYLFNMADHTVTNITNSPGVNEFTPIWSTSGDQIAFSVQLDLQVYSTYRINPDGGGLFQLPATSARDIVRAWSPDDTRLVFQAVQANQVNLHLVEIDERRFNYRQLTTDVIWSVMQWSPDGERLAVTRTINGMFIPYIINLDNGEETRLTNKPAVLLP